MRLSQRSVARREHLVTAVISIFAGVGALALASVFLSFFAAWGDMSAGTVKAMSGAALAAGCFACSFVSANRRRRKGLLSGLICGAAVFCLTLIIGAFTVRIFSAGGFFCKLLIVLSASALGGLKGVNTRPVFGD